MPEEVNGGTAEAPQAVARAGAIKALKDVIEAAWYAIHSTREASKAEAWRGAVRYMEAALDRAPLSPREHPYCDPLLPKPLTAEDWNLQCEGLTITRNPHMVEGVSVNEFLREGLQRGEFTPDDIVSPLPDGDECWLVEVQHSAVTSSTVLASTLASALAWAKFNCVDYVTREARGV